MNYAFNIGDTIRFQYIENPPHLPPASTDMFVLAQPHDHPEYNCRDFAGYVDENDTLRILERHNPTSSPKYSTFKYYKVECLNRDLIGWIMEIRGIWKKVE